VHHMSMYAPFSVPLSDHRSLAVNAASWARTSSLNRARELAGSALYSDQTLRPLDEPEGFSMEQRVVSMGPVSLIDTTFGTDMRIDCGGPRDTYHVNLPLTGHVRSEHRGQRVIAVPGRAALYRPDGKTALPLWAGGSRQLSVKIDRAAVERAVKDLLGSEPVLRAGQLAFEPSMDVTEGAARDWAQLVLLLNEQLARPESLAHQPLVGRPLVDSLVRGLLLAADHPQREALVASPEPARPTAVRTAIDVMESEPQEPMTASSLAERSHVSVRSLQEGFRRHTGTTPMRYLRSVRLRHAHEELLAADPSVTTVATVALRWGFTNLGRFAAEHQAAYGTQPVQTLRSGR
jgi:AraC-like DNA-binding protein